MNRFNLPLFPRPTAVADYLRHRYRIQPGEALCIALGEPEASDNYEALTTWAAKALARGDGLDLDHELRRIEAELCARMCETGLIDQFHETFPVPVNVISRLYPTPRTPCRKEARVRLHTYPTSPQEVLLDLINRSNANE